MGNKKIPERRHIPGKFESGKFEYRRESYLNYLSALENMGYETSDYLHYFPSFVGDMTLSRILALYESYKDTLSVQGHIADVGMFKGASMFLFAKLVKIFEPNSLVQVHGFDWFEGNQPDPWESNLVPGAGKESYSRIKKLCELQDLDYIAKIHKLDLTKELEKFFSENLHLKFKLVFMDAGMYSVVKASLPFFWERLTKGGVIIFDQYNCDQAPGETLAVDEFFKSMDAKIRTYPFTWMPTAYVVKS